MRRLATISLLVRDLDDAIAHYVGVLGFTLVEDTDLGAGRRWVRVSPGGGDACFLLAVASTPEQQAAVGRQTGGRVSFFIETDDFARDHAAMLARGTDFRETPRVEPYGTVAVFADLYGNLFDLIQHRR